MQLKHKEPWTVHIRTFMQEMVLVNFLNPVSTQMSRKSQTI